MRTCTHARTHARTHPHIHARTHSCTHARTHAQGVGITYDMDNAEFLPQARIKIKDWLSIKARVRRMRGLRACVCLCLYVSVSACMCEDACHNCF